jgi:Domain of unknown function (DUF4279)
VKNSEAGKSRPTLMSKRSVSTQRVSRRSVGRSHATSHSTTKRSCRIAAMFVVGVSWRKNSITHDATATVTPVTTGKHPLRISQYTYFALKSETVPASTITARLGIEPDCILVRGARRPAPPIPVCHMWAVECRQRGLAVDDQVAQVLARVRPVAEAIRTLTASGSTSAVLQIVRHFNDDEGETDDNDLIVTQDGRLLEKLGGQHRLLGWHLELEDLAFLASRQRFHQTRVEQHDRNSVAQRRLPAITSGWLRGEPHQRGYARRSGRPHHHTGRLRPDPARPQPPRPDAPDPRRRAVRCQPIGMARQHSHPIDSPSASTRSGAAHGRIPSGGRRTHDGASTT